LIWRLRRRKMKCFDHSAIFLYVLEAKPYATRI
jgi:hypothetical protein